MSTMSARVLNPSVLSELRRVRTPKGSSVSCCSTQSASAAAAASASVRRNLFGRPGPEEGAVIRLAQEERQRRLEEDCRRWNFDFRAERPLAGHHRYVYTPVSMQRSTLVSLSRTSISNTRTITASSSSPRSGVEGVSVNVITKSAESPKVQSRITDFMKPRKRSASGQNTSGGPPSKMSRPMSSQPPPTTEHTTC